MEMEAWIDAWLQGELSPSDLVRFEERRRSDPQWHAAAQLAERLQASLTRSFAPQAGEPRGVAAVLAELGEGSAPRPAASASVVTIWLAAAAGFFLLLAFLDREQVMKPLEALPGSVSQLAQPVSLSGFGGAKAGQGGRVSPNLEGILCAAEDYTERLAADTCLVQQPATAMGLSAEATGILSGPITTPEWPGSLVFTHQSTAGMSLLIAGQDGQNTCCLEVRPPANSELRVHTWRVGETLWYEVSPFDEPQLLSFVDD